MPMVIKCNAMFAVVLGRVASAANLVSSSFKVLFVLLAAGEQPMDRALAFALASLH